MKMITISFDAERDSRLKNFLSTPIDSRASEVPDEVIYQRNNKHFIYRPKAENKKEIRRIWDHRLNRVATSYGNRTKIIPSRLIPESTLPPKDKIIISRVEDVAENRSVGMQGPFYKDSYLPHIRRVEPDLSCHVPKFRFS